jgi:anti-sigma factor (TIGR02949 family)
MKKLIKCAEVVNHICEHLDTEMDRERCRQIKRHVKNCPNCYAYLDSMKKTVHLYKLERVPRTPSRLRKELFAVLNLGSK